MSTFTTNKEDQEYRIVRQEIQALQESIVRQRAEIIALITKLELIRTRKVFSLKEQVEKSEQAKLAERQLNESRRSLNRSEARVLELAQLIGID
ncbi:MAG: hypothetical protein Q7K40_01630 [bacterium]|nr:hypothetical protein [bacterium]